MAALLASRCITVDGRPVEVSITAPVPIEQDSYTCTAIIEGLEAAEEPIELTSGGADAIQAIIHTLAVAGTRLAASGQAVEWLGLQTSGLPVIGRSDDNLTIGFSMPLTDESSSTPASPGT